MKKIFLLAFIFILVSPKSIPSVNLGVNTTFDMNNNEFKFQYSGPGKDIILFYFKLDNNCVDYDIDCPNGGSGSSISGSSEFSKVFQQIEKKGTCTITFEPKEENKGSFVIYTLNSKLSIKLKNKYGNLLSESERDFNWISVSQLTFSVPKLDRDVNAKFEYSNNVYIDGDPFTIENPFKVCHGKECEENLSTYEFKKGESYEVSVKVSKVANEDDDKYIIIPGFTFYDSKYNGTYSPDDILDGDTSYASGLKAKLLFISLILLLL